MTGWELLGLLLSAALITLLSIGFYRIRLKGIVAARKLLGAAQELASEQQRLRSVIEGTHAGTWMSRIGVRAGEGEIIVDHRWAAAIGRTPEELNPLRAGRLFSPELMHPDDVAACRAAIAEYHEHEGKVLEIDVRLRHAAGHWVWVQVRGKVIERDEYGRPLRAAGTQMDISARKQVELALVDSESNFRSLFELSPVGIVLVEFRTGRFLQVNDAMVASTGYSREELLQRTYMDITPACWHELERQQVKALETSTHFGVYEKEYQR